MANEGLTDRRDWVQLAEKLGRPVLTALAARKLKETMPVEVAPGGDRLT